MARMIELTNKKWQIGDLLKLPGAIWLFSFLPVGLLIALPVPLLFVLYYMLIPSIILIVLTPLVTIITTVFLTIKNLKDRPDRIHSFPYQGGSLTSICTAEALNKLTILNQLYIILSFGATLVVGCAPATTQYFADGYDPCVISPLGNTSCQGLLNLGLMPHTYDFVQWIGIYFSLAAASICFIGLNFMTSALGSRLTLRVKNPLIAAALSAIIVVPLIVVMVAVITPEMFLANLANTQLNSLLFFIIFDIVVATLPFIAFSLIMKPNEYTTT